jgi:hypothetical protein
MRAALIVLLVAMGMEAAPAAACPIASVGDAAVIAAPGTGPAPTVFLDPGSAVAPWQLSAAGARSDGAPAVQLTVRVRPLAGTRLLLLDLPFDAGTVDIWISDARGAMAHREVHIEPPGEYFLVGDDDVRRAPDVPTAPAWPTPAVTAGITAIAALMLGLGAWIAHRRQRAVAV